MKSNINLYIIQISLKCRAKLCFISRTKLPLNDFRNSIFAKIYKLLKIYASIP